MITQPDLQTRLETLATKLGVPGAAVVVVKDGQTVQAVTGTTNVITGYPVLPTTWFAVGSVTKVFTATMVMMLVDAGQVDLDAPVRTYVDDFSLSDRDASAKVTVRMLLTHMSGLPGNFMLDLPKNPDMVRQQVERLATIDFNSRPGELWSYSNAGLVTLGRIIEVITKQTWDSALNQMLLEPLGINGSSITEEMILHSTAVGHMVDPVTGVAKRVDRFQIDTSNGPTGATLWCDIAGIAAFGSLHLNAGKTHDGRQLLAAETVADMQDPQAQVPWAVGVDCWGLGWAITGSEAHKLLSHTGANSGCHSTLTLVPNQGGLVALMTNGSSGMFLNAQLTNELLLELFGITPPRPPLPAETTPDVDLEPCIGVYAADDSSATVTLRYGKLVVDQVNSAQLDRELDSMGFPPPEPATLTPVDADGHFLASSGMPVSFVTPTWSQRPEYLYIGRIFRRIDPDGGN